MNDAYTYIDDGSSGGIGSQIVVHNHTHTDYSSRVRAMCVCVCVRVQLACIFTLPFVIDLLMSTYKTELKQAPKPQTTMVNVFRSKIWKLFGRFLAAFGRHTHTLHSPQIDPQRRRTAYTLYINNNILTFWWNWHRDGSARVAWLPQLQSHGKFREWHKIIHILKPKNCRAKPKKNKMKWNERSRERQKAKWKDGDGPQRATERENTYQAFMELSTI